MADGNGGAIVLAALFLVGLVARTVLSNPSIVQSEDTCVYSFQVPRQDSHAACSDSVSLDQQLLKTMILSLQQHVTQLQDQLRNAHGASMEKRNIRQCSWRDINDDRQDGQIRTCIFRKNANDTVLRVVWNGDLRLIRDGSASACRRWFFTINGHLCGTPASIDTQLHTLDSANNMHRPAYLEGLCQGVASGDLQVTFNVGDCVSMSSFQKGDSYTGWTSTSRIIVEELDVQEPELIL